MPSSQHDLRYNVCMVSFFPLNFTSMPRSFFMLSPTSAFHMTNSVISSFCPTGNFPTVGSPIHPNDNIHDDKCLDVRGAVYANGTPVQMWVAAELRLYLRQCKLISKIIEDTTATEPRPNAGSSTAEVPRSNLQGRISAWMLGPVRLLILDFLILDLTFLTF